MDLLLSTFAGAAGGAGGCTADFVGFTSATGFLLYEIKLRINTLKTLDIDFKVRKCHCPST